MSARTRAGAGAIGPGGSGRSIELARSGRRTDIVVDGIPYSTHHPDRPWSGYAWDAIAASAAWIEAPRPDVLLLGAGAGTVLVLLRRLLPGASLVAIELDPRMIALGRERGGVAQADAEVLEGDALEFLARTRRKFDLILDDMFAPTAAGLGRPVADELAHLRRIASRLAKGGIAATNVTTDGDPPGLERTVAAAYRATFPHRLSLAPRRGYNLVHAGSASPLPPARLRERAEAADPVDREGLLSVRARKG